MATDKYPRLRKTFATLLLFGLVGLFFAFNYLVYIPHQQNMYNEKVFRVIHEMAEEIMSRTKANQDYLARSFGNPDTATHTDNFISRSADTLAVQLKTDLNNSFNGYEPGKKDAPVKLCNFHFVPDSIQFLPENYHYPALSLNDIFSDMEKLHPNFFLHLMLAETDSIFKNKHSLLYKSPSLAVESKINGDSLLKTNNSFQFATLRDMNIEGQDYKLFLLPFTFGNQELLLGGFITDDVYKANASGYSSYTFVLIGILVALIIISLPVIKIFMLGRQENITILDVRMLMVSLVLAPVFVLLVAAGSWISNVADTITDSLLDSVHTSVTNNFYKEISLAVKQLKNYDSTYSKPEETKVFKNLQTYYRNHHADSTQTSYNDKNNFKDSLFYPAFYRNMDNIFWINKDGQQIAKWYLLKQDAVYLNLSGRQYFKDGLENKFYTLPKTYSSNKLRGDSFLIEPTMSWSTGQYNINLVIKSNQQFKNDKAVIIGMSGNFYSVCNPVTPKGLNFCIVNDTGTILIHSQTYRSLHENIFEECYNDKNVKSAIINKSTVILPAVNLYGKDVKMKISPLKGMPFYLVSYYDKKDQRFFTSHIIRFTFFVTCMQLLMLLVYLVYYYFVSLKKTDLYFSSGDSSWMKPSSKRVDIYIQVFIVELVILALLILLLPVMNEDERYPFMLQAILMLPFYVTTAYYIIRRTHSCMPIKKLVISYYFFVGILFSFINILLDYYDDATRATHHNTVESDLFADISIIVFSAALPWIVIFCIKLQQKKQLFKNTSYLNKYIMAIFLTIILFSVVPFMGFISYAFHEELTMQSKARQYDIAQQIDKRRTLINEALDDTKLSFAKDTPYVMNRKFAFEYGIYLPRNKVHPVNDTAQYNFYDNENLYKFITNFLMLPADHVDFFDNNDFYNWKKDKQTKILSLIYKNDRDIITPDYIQIESKLRYTAAFNMIFTRTSGWLMLLVLTLFFIIHFKLIRSLIKKIFLLDYFNEEEAGGEQSLPETAGRQRSLAWLNKQFKMVSLTATDELLFCAGGTLTYDVVIAKERLCSTGTSSGAECIMLIQQILTPCYKNIWRSCSDDEKFILYDFAMDGFTNYKNADILYGLYLKGLIIKKENQLLIMTKSFRNFLIAKTDSTEIKRLKLDLRIGSAWGTVKQILFFLLFLTLLFLFITQKEISKELITVISGLLTLVPLMLKLFDKSAVPGQGKQQP